MDEEIKYRKKEKDRLENEKVIYEVWNFLGSGAPDFISEDAVEVVNWLRARPYGDRHFNVHVRGPYFLTGKKISHDFISLHKEAVADDIVRKAFAAGNPEGVAKEIIDLVFLGR